MAKPRALPYCQSFPPKGGRLPWRPAALPHRKKALPSGELSSGCETERVCVAAFARGPLMLLLSVLSKPSPDRGKVSRNAVTRRMRAHRQMLLLVTYPSSGTSCHLLPLLSLCDIFPRMGEICPQGGKASVETVNLTALQKSSPLGRAVERMRDGEGFPTSAAERVRRPFYERSIFPMTHRIFERSKKLCGKIHRFRWIGF